MAEGLARRFRDWWTTPPRIPESALAAPIVDEGLASDMARLADEIARGDDRLDYSVTSLEHVQERLRGGSVEGDDLRGLGAYLGEVLRRNAPGTAWAWSVGRHRRPPEPAIAVAKWVTEPFDWVDRVASGRAHPDTSMVDYCESIKTLATGPFDEAAERLGLKTRLPTNGAALRQSWHRLRRRRWLHT